MSALSIAYPHYWCEAANNEAVAGATFDDSIEELKHFYSASKSVELPASEGVANEVVQCEGLLDAGKLDAQAERLRHLAIQCATKAMSIDKSDA